MNDYLQMTDRDIVCQIPINLETIKLVQEIAKMDKNYQGEDVLDVIYGLIIEKHDELTAQQQEV